MCLSQDILCTQKYVKLKGYLQSVIYMIILSLCTECIDCTFADVRKNKTRNPEISCLSNVCFSLCTLNRILQVDFLSFCFFFFAVTSAGLCTISASPKNIGSYQSSCFLGDYLTKLTYIYLQKLEELLSD